MPSSLPHNNDQQPADSLPARTGSIIKTADIEDHTQSTARMALKILGLFSETEPVLRVSEIGRRLGIHKSKASRLVAALAAEEFLTRTSNGCYCLGFRLHAIGATIPHSRALLEAARSELYQIRKETHESVHLSVLVGTEVVHVERLYADHLMKYFLSHSQKPPIHATSAGKVLLAHAPEPLLERVISQGLLRYTTKTITDQQTLRLQLATIRACGFAINRDEFSEGLSSVAVPVLTKDGHNAALAVVAPSDHLIGRRLDDALRTLRHSVSVIARMAAQRRENPIATMSGGALKHPLRN